jgi:arylsulfatase A-like enzyme
MLPHKPLDPPERLQAQFRATEVPVPPFIQGDAEEFQAAERTAYAMGAWFDEGLAALRAKLAACGELEDTLFVFLNDNGHTNGFPSKGTVFEKGLRTPIVVSWPKAVAPGRRENELVYSIDLYRTLLDYAGVPAPEGAGGQSLRASLEGAPHAPRSVLYGAAYAFREQGRPRPENSVYALYARTARWKFVRYLKDVTPEAFALAHEFASFPAAERGERTLYDLEMDPYERNDLSANPEHAPLMAEFEAGALAWWREGGGEELDLGGESGDTQAGRKGRKRKQDR